MNIFFEHRNILLLLLSKASAKSTKQEAHNPWSSSKWTFEMPLRVFGGSSYFSLLEKETL
jgi:hypothetical protein